MAQWLIVRLTPCDGNVVAVRIMANTYERFDFWLERMVMVYRLWSLYGHDPFGIDWNCALRARLGA